MPRYQVTICPDCSAALGAGGAASIVTTDTGLTCTHATAVSYVELQYRDTACLVTIISMRPASMTPEIRTFRLTQQDLDGLASQRPNMTPADWAHACLGIDLEAVYADVEFGKPQSESHDCNLCSCGMYEGEQLIGGQWELCKRCGHLAQDHA